MQFELCRPETIEDIMNRILAGNAKIVKPFIVGSISSHKADKPAILLFI
jgi:hypothetical protein